MTDKATSPCLSAYGLFDKPDSTVGHTGINACGEDFGPVREYILDEAGIPGFSRGECQRTDRQLRYGNNLFRLWQGGEFWSGDALAVDEHRGEER